jgi:hypothetical protein
MVRFTKALNPGGSPARRAVAVRGDNGPARDIRRAKDAAYDRQYQGARFSGVQVVVVGARGGCTLSVVR